MSWAKRNLYFLICCVIAVVLLGAAGWYCFSQSQANNSNWEQLNSDYQQIQQITEKSPNAGNEKVDNIAAAREQTKEVQQRVAEVRKFFKPVPPIPADTNKLDDRTLAFAVQKTIAQLRSGAQQHNVLVTPEFAFSFSLQQTKAAYDPQSWPQLARDLGEVKAICETLYGARVIALDSIQRERTADDGSGAMSAGGADYVDSTSVTNETTIITPYQVTFRCFTTELGSVISGFANGQRTIIVKTIAIQPEEAMPGMEAMAQPNATMAAAARGGLPTVIDEKKLKVTMFLDFVKALPEQGK